MNARDIMVTDVETVGPDDRISDTLGRLARADFSGFPVVDDDDDSLVGIVTEHDLISLFDPEERVLWIPIGFPPFLETVSYGFDISWDELDLGTDLLTNARKPVRSVMTEDVITVGPTDDLDRLLVLLTDPERNINRLPVVEDDRVVGIITRQDVLRGVRRERDDD